MENLGRTILVTGASGLIGRWLGQRLCAEKRPWVGLDHKPALEDATSVKHYVVDMCDADLLKSAIAEIQPQLIVHLAARTDLEGKAADDYAVNIEGVRNLCEAVRQTSSVQRVLYTSSQLVCDVGYVPSSDTEYCPHTPYGESKVLTEKIVRELDGGGVNWCLLRPTTVWGAHMQRHYVKLLSYIQQGKYFHHGSGQLLKSYAYAGNIAYQYARFLDADDAAIQGKTFYLADYEPLSLRAYIDGIADRLGVKRPITLPLPLTRFLALGGDVLNLLGYPFPYNSFRQRNIRTEYVFDLSGTREICGPLPYSFEEGLDATVDWFKQR